MFLFLTTVSFPPAGSNHTILNLWVALCDARGSVRHGRIAEYDAASNHGYSAAAGKRGRCRLSLAPNHNAVANGGIDAMTNITTGP